MKNRYILTCLTFVMIPTMYGMNPMTNPAHPLNPVSPLNPINPLWENNYSSQTIKDRQESLQQRHDALQKKKEQLRIRKEHRKGYKNGKDAERLSQYDCEALMVQFSHLKGSQKEMDERLKGSLQQYLATFNLKEEWMINRQIASLICFGSNPNIVAENSSGHQHIRPLEVAVETDDAPLVSLLLEHGAKTNIDNMRWWKDIKDKYFKHYGLSNFKERPLLFKIRSVDVAKKLVPHIDLQTRDKGNTVLHERVNHDELLEYYVEHSDLVNTVNDDGNLPLHVAAYWCNTRAVQLLLPKTDSINTLNKKVQTPSDIATQRRSKYPDSCEQTIELFKEYKAIGSFNAE